MDLIKNYKDLKAYCSELSVLHGSITAHESRLKIGKYKIVETPSKEVANRLQLKLQALIEGEHNAMTGIYKKIESTIEEIQTDLFKTKEGKEDDNTIVFGSKVH